MAITAVFLQVRGPLTQTKDRATIEDVYRVICDSVTDDQEFVLANMSVGNAPANVPVYYSPHPQNPSLGLYDQTIKTVEDGNVLAWDVVCRYSSNSNDFDSGGNSSDGPLGAFYQNPLDKPPEISIGTVSVERAVPFDVDTGLPIVSTAYQPFDPPVVDEVKNSTLVITRIETGFTDAKRRTYLNKINSEAFGDKVKGSVLMKDLTASILWVNNNLYWKVRYELEWADPDLWIPDSSNGSVFIYHRTADGTWVTLTKGTDELYSWDDYVPNLDWKMLKTPGDEDTAEDIWVTDTGPVARSSADTSEDAPANSPFDLDRLGQPGVGKNHYIRVRRKKLVDFSPLNLPGDVD